MLNNMRDQLLNTNSLVDFVDVLSKFYDLKNCRPYKLVLTLLTKNIIKHLDIKDRHIIDTVMQSKTLYDYLKTFGYYYDERNDTFKSTHKIKLIENINTVMTMTGCKKR
jgi:hypothetical protein